jgi:hypothetical protein
MEYARFLTFWPCIGICKISRATIHSVAAMSAFTEFGRFRAAKSHKLIVRFALFAVIRFFESWVCHNTYNQVVEFSESLQVAGIRFFMEPTFSQTSNEESNEYSH